jgi:hypothetical protein
MDISQTKATARSVLWGAVAIALAIVGFSWGGWVTGGSAETLATSRAATAVVAALTPICVEKFRQAADASANLAEMKKATYVSDQSKFVKKEVGPQCREAPSQTRPLQGLVLNRSVAKKRWSNADSRATCAAGRNFPHGAVFRDVRTWGSSLGAGASSCDFRSQCPALRLPLGGHSVNIAAY